MKKVGAFIILLLLVLSLESFASAENNSINDSETNYSSSSTTQQQDLSKIEKGFECLEEKVGDDCSGAGTVQELALTILASPNNVFDECVDKLKAKESNNHYGNVLDTALAILALNHAGEDTDDAEQWLLSKNMSATDLTWYLQQDSNEAAQCKISYSGNDYTINVADNKKIDSSAGSCLSLAQSNFWLQVSQSCYDKEFAISCDKKFIATLLYRYKNSPIIYVLSDTESEPAFGTINLKIRAKCFGIDSCDYEGSVWATLALLKTGHNVEDFIPYVIALAEPNKRFLPNSFIYMITNFNEYGTKLIEEQKLGNYWQADSTAYNKFYDTGLALLALFDSSAEQVVKARDWALFSQDSNGCWNSNNIRDTAILLWALEGRAGRSVSGAGVTYCSEANYFCIPREDCPSNQQLENYFCSGLGSVCCMSENLKLCSEYGGEECLADEVCIGNEKKSADIMHCCVGECSERTVQNECESMGYICKSSCSENQEQISYACDSGEVCCRTKTTPKKSYWWIWLLIILILIVAGAIAWIFRDKLKLWFFKLKSKFRKDKGRPPQTGPGYPPRPGFPPIRRQPMPVGRPIPQSKDNVMDNVFKKLKEMSK